MQMSQERSEALAPSSLAEILRRDGVLLETLALEQDAPLRLEEAHLERPVKLPWTTLDSHEVVSIVEWPDHHTWAGEPSIQFGSGTSGDMDFFERAVEPSEMIDDEIHGFNNLWAILNTRPYAFNHEIPKTGREVAYAPLPALIRVWTAFPEFMDALQRELHDIGAIYEMEGALTEQIEAEEPHMLRASRLAYGLLTRLVCKHDHELQARLQDHMFSAVPDEGPRRRFAPISDPSIELWT